MFYMIFHLEIEEKDRNNWYDLYYSGLNWMIRKCNLRIKQQTNDSCALR